MRTDWRDALRRWWPSGFGEGAGPLADWLVRDRADGNAADPRQFSAWLPYRAYDADGALFQNRDGVGFCLDVLPQAGADERMAEILQSLVANCPPGAGLQLHLFASPAVRGMLTRYANLRVKDTDHLPRMQAAGRPVRQKNVFRALARKRVGFLLAGASRSLTQGFHYTVRDFRLVLSVHLPGRLRDFARREELLSLREAMVTTLNAAAFPSRPFDAADLIAWCAIFCNPQRILVEAPPPTYDEGRELFEQIVDFDTAQEALADGRGLRFSAADPSAAAAIEVRFYAVKTFPERFALWQMGGLTGDLLQGALQYPCPFLLTLGVETLDPETTRAAVYANQTRATQNAESQMAKLLPDIPKKKRDWDAAADALDAGTKLVSLYHELALFTPPDRATQAEESAKAIWRSRGFELNNDVYLHRQSLQASLPMQLSENFHRDLKRLRRVTTKTAANAVHLAPLLAEWKGTPTPVLLFAGRRGQLLTLDLFDNDQGNYNAAVIGTSGSGKSVLLNEIAWSYRAIGAKVWMLDLGRSFEKLCRVCDGQLIEFRASAAINVNPFSAVTDIHEDMAMLQPVVAKMASPLHPLAAFEYKALASAILIAWAAHGPAMTVTAIRDVLATGRLRDAGTTVDRRLQDLAVMLEPFCLGGAYSRFFDGPATVDFSNDFVVIEEEELKQKPDLHLVVNLILLYRITRAMYETRDRKKLLIIDELKQQLGTTGEDDPVLAQVVEEAARRARKYGGALITATQGADDYYATAATTAAFNFSDWVFLLRQKQESIELLDRSGRISMDDYKKRLLQSLRTERGVFSETYVHSPMGEGVARLLLDPHTLLLFSNRLEDNAPLDAKRAQGLPIDQAISELLQERGINA
ncbi:MAG: type IV secretion system protein TraC [Betaproteobacteria bacterium]|nr:type IV secretion system protein TraC [Betaproteobacteria bacterium]